VTAGEGERLDRYMARANAAYYAERDPYADFTTAPEISQVFGEILGFWAAVAWQGMGRPDPVLLAEAGPGRGTLMADALRAIARVTPDFRAALRLHLIETSPRLRARQAALLPAAIWHERLDDLPPGPLLLLANEFLDALPIRQFVRRGAGWAERFVNGGAYVERPPEPASAAPRVRRAVDSRWLACEETGERHSNVVIASGAKQSSPRAGPWIASPSARNDDRAVDVARHGRRCEWSKPTGRFLHTLWRGNDGEGGREPAEGEVVEICEPARKLAARLGARLASEGGAALFLDYGPERSAPGESLQALRDGRPADPLADPGAADLTAHVDFQSFARCARSAGAAVHGPVPQGLFLARLGLFQRTDRLARGQPPARAAALIAAARRLAEPMHMGRLFKALALARPGLPTPPGFAADA